MVSPAGLLKTSKALRCLWLFPCLQSWAVCAPRSRQWCGTQDLCVQRDARGEPMPWWGERRQGGGLLQELFQVVEKRFPEELGGMFWPSSRPCSFLFAVVQPWVYWTRTPQSWGSFPFHFQRGVSLWMALPQPLPEPSVPHAGVL